MDNIFANNHVSARLPTAVGQFQLHLFTAPDQKEHLALVLGDVRGRHEVLVRIHSECFTGDVLGSARCDCGQQLERAMALVAEAGAGVIVYLRQEGRGIGLLEKLRAYNLQDEGYDTVEANLLLGHQADQRDYTMAAHILQELGVKSVQLLTNNPQKIDSLRQMGINVTARIPLYGDVTHENEKYIATKIERLNHFPPQPADPDPGQLAILAHIQRRLAAARGLARQTGRPFVTLTYAQTLDGSIALRPESRLHISNTRAYALTHHLRASHDAILVGIGTVLADDPRLTVRLVAGSQPQPVILDSQLRCPPEANLLRSGARPPWILTGRNASAERQARLEALGANVFRLENNAGQPINLEAALALLAQQGIQRLMVEGGGQVISSFLKAQQADQMVLTVAPLLVGGLRAVSQLELASEAAVPRLHNLHHQFLDDNLILRGDPLWPAI